MAAIDHSRVRGASILAVGATCSVMILGAFVLKAYERTVRPSLFLVDPETTPFWGPAGFNSYAMRVLERYDAKGQALGHCVAVLAVALLILSSPLLKRMLPAFERPWIRTAALSLAVSTGLAAYALCLRYGGKPWWTPITATSVLTTLGLMAVGNTLCRGRFDALGAAIVLGLVLAADLPGVFSIIDLSSDKHYMLIDIQQHFSTVLGSADRLAVGQRLFEDVYPSYGVLLQCLLASYQSHVRLLSMGEVIMILQLLQFVYLACCTLVYYRFSRGRWWLCLLALLLVVPWYYYSNHQAVLHPNHSAWRTIGFPLALLAIALVHGRRLATSSLALGCVAGLLLLINTESGIAASLGLFATLFYRARASWPWRPFPILLDLALFPLGVMASWLGFVLAWRILQGYWLDLLAPREIFEVLAASASSGVAGTMYPGDLLPIALFAWSSFVLIALGLAGGSQPGLTDSIRIGVAVIALVWLSYYANHSDFGYLGSSCFLYGFPAIDAARTLLSRAGRRGLRNPTGLAAFALTSVVTIPYLSIIVVRNYEMRQHINLRGTLPAQGTALDGARVRLSGVDLDADLGQEIATKSRAIARIGRAGPVIYLTMDSYLITKVSGVIPRLPINGLLFEAWTRRDYCRILDSILDSGAREIYVDPPEEEAEGPRRYFPKFYKKLLGDLQVKYRFDHTLDGWEVWSRRGNSGTADRRGWRGPLPQPRPVSQAAGLRTAGRDSDSETAFSSAGPNSL